jgi:predicted sulfurtransferase
MGSSDSSKPARPFEAAAPYASPQAFHDILARANQQADKETVLLDVRNHYETGIGRFQKVCCPVYGRAYGQNLH